MTSEQQKRIDEIREYEASKFTPNSTMPFLLNCLDELQQNNIDLESLFKLQQTRMGEAVNYWREKTGQTNFSPDLGELLEFLLSEIATLKAELERHKKQWQADMETNDSMIKFWKINSDWYEAENARLIAELARYESKRLSPTKPTFENVEAELRWTQEQLRIASMFTEVLPELEQLKSELKASIRRDGK